MVGYGGLFVGSFMGIEPLENQLMWYGEYGWYIANYIYGKGAE